MSQRKILFQRIVSSDGQSIAEAKSEVVNSDLYKTVSHQSVGVTVSSTSMSRSSSSCSSRFSSEKLASN
jgi:hypothetical protein